MIRERVWLGGSDSRVESTWQWSDGTPWANESVLSCSDVSAALKYGLKTCTNWAPQHPTGGRDKNCLVVAQSQQWRSDECDGKKRYWCQIPDKSLPTGTKSFSWRLADITFSKIELWLNQKTGEGTNTCNSSSQMPGFSITWSTTNVKGRGIIHNYDQWEKTSPRIANAVQCHSFLPGL